MSSQGQIPSPSPIIMHEHFRDPPTSPLRDYVIYEPSLKHGSWKPQLESWNTKPRIVKSNPAMATNVETVMAF